MERLTQKHEIFDYVLPEQNAVGNIQTTEILIGDTEYTAKKYIYGEAIRELGELEDVLEKYNIKDIEDLELRLEDIEHYAYQENQQLVDILAKYGIENLDILDLNLQTIKNINIQNANLRNELAKLKQKVIVPKFERQSQVYGFAYGRIKQYVVIAYLDNMNTLCEDTQANTIDACNNDYLVETKEEAEQKLAEIGGKDE